MVPTYLNPILAESVLEMILLFGDDGTISYANREALALLGYDESIVGTSIFTIFPTFAPGDEEPDRPISKILTGEIVDAIAYRANKTCFHTRTKFVADVGDGQHGCMAVNTSEEEFLRKEASNAGTEAKEADKVKTEFVANVTHELRTPVNGILGNARDLLSVVTDREQIKKLNHIEKSCENMNNIISSILDFSKLSAGKFTLEMREFNFRNMIDYVKENHKSRINEKGLEFFVSVSPEVPEMIIGDELRIVQILNNLLSNATKFTSVGKIALEIFKTGKVGNKVELFFLVVDTGIGIDKSDLSKLFKSFSQVDASISRTFGGTGLGLNITKQLVEMMGGTIECESEKDKGSTFSFSIWIEVPAGEVVAEDDYEDEVKAYVERAEAEEEEEADGLKKFGSEENFKELENRLSKLILCVEMQNWERAEMFADSIKQLTVEAPPEVRSIMLHLKMAVQKENYDKAAENYKEFSDYIANSRRDNNG